MKFILVFLISISTYFPLNAYADPPDGPPGGATNLATRVEVLEALVAELQAQLQAWLRLHPLRAV